MNTRFINCEICHTEGSLLTNDCGPYDAYHGPCPVCDGERVVEIEGELITLQDLEQVGREGRAAFDNACATVDARAEDFHPDQNLPGCMMPDGGDCCAGHAAVVEDWHKQRREIELLRGLLKEVTERGLIYWEPQTTRGAMAKADMIARVEAVIAGSNTIEAA